jgi:heme/copper-type cytochrome/quinol oxidase subunit 2
VSYGCINVNCRSVFREWLSIKLQYVAMVGFTLTILFIIMIVMSITIWGRLSNSNQRILWHSRPIEIMLLIISVLIMAAGTFFVIVEEPSKPVIFPYA